jgi:hypothetical protein
MSYENDVSDFLQTPLPKVLRLLLTLLCAAVGNKTADDKYVHEIWRIVIFVRWRCIWVSIWFWCWRHNRRRHSYRNISLLFRAVDRCCNLLIAKKKHFVSNILHNLYECTLNISPILYGGTQVTCVCIIDPVHTRYYVVRTSY